MKIFYTYLWLREDGTPYYVGKGSGDRAFVKRHHRLSPPKDRTLILVQEFPDEDSSFAAEIFLVGFYGREDLGTGCLLNLTNGGENPPRAKKGVGIGRKLSSEHRNKISEGNLGHRVSEETRKKLSRPCLPETKEKIGKANKGKPNPHKGSTLPEWQIKKISESKKGHTVSSETRRKISETLKARKSKVLQ